MTDTDMNVSITSQRGHAQAIAFAAKGGKALSELLFGIAKAKETERQGALKGFLFLTQHYTDGEQHSIPVPGSKKGETGNLPFDKYTTEVTTSDGKKKVPGSWFTDAVKMTPAFDHYNNIVLWCDDKEVEDREGNAIPKPEWLSKMGSSELRAQKKQAKQAVTDMRTGLTKSAMLFHHAEAISELNPDRIKIKMPFKAFRVEGRDEPELRVISNIIRILDPAEELEGKEYTVSEFLALKPEKLALLKKEERDIAKLNDTKERGAKGRSKKGSKTEYPVPSSVEQALNYFNIGGTMLDMETEQGSKMNAALLTAVAARKMDVIMSIGAFLIRADNLWTQVGPIYTAEMARRGAAAAAAAQAERQAKTGT